MGEDENEVKEISEEEYEYGFGAEAREDAALEATAKALAEGEARGKAEGKAEAVRAMLAKKLLSISLPALPD